MQYIAAITNPSQRAEVERWAAFTNSFTPQQTIQCVRKVGLMTKWEILSEPGSIFTGKTEHSDELFPLIEIYS